MPQGLTGLAGLQTLEEDTPYATAEQRQGGPVNPRHENLGEAAKPYSWESQQIQTGSHGPYGNDGLVDEMTDGPWLFGLPAGTIYEDPTGETKPWTHAAPFPKDPIGDGSADPDNIGRQLEQSASIHSSVTGGKRNTRTPTMYAQQDNWHEIWEINPGHTDLEAVGPQMRSGLAPGGRGGTDRTQSNAHQNDYGFDAAHMHRRYAWNSIPGNYLWMRPGGRPMIKSLAGPARPAVGPESPFYGDDLGTAFGTDGAILGTQATAYQAPPVPYVAPSAPVDNGDVMSYQDAYGLGDY